MCEVCWVWCSAGEMGHCGAVVVVEVVQAVNKEEKLRGVEQRRVTTGGRTQGLSPSFPVRTVQDKAQGPVWLPLFNPGSSSSSADWSLSQLGCPWGAPAVAPADLGAAPCPCALGYQCSVHSFPCLSVLVRVRNGLALSRAGSWLPQSVGGSSSVPPPAPVAERADVGVCTGAQAWLPRVQIPAEP